MFSFFTCYLEFEIETKHKRDRSRIDLVVYSFAADFRINATILGDDKWVLHGEIQAVSYTHLDVYKRQVLYCFQWVRNTQGVPGMAMM